MTTEAKETAERIAGASLDHLLRQRIPVGMQSGIHLRIDKIVGFELFNTRPYHNYETWSSGYRVEGPVEGDWNPWRDFNAVATELELDEEAVKRLWRAATGGQARVLSCSKEDLGEALREWFARREQVVAILAEDPPKVNHRTRLAVLGYHFPEGEPAGKADSDS